MTGATKVEILGLDMEKGKMTRLVLAIAAGVIFLGSGRQIEASPITYTLSTAASGTLGGSPFTNAAVTVTLTGDTANVAPGPVPFTDVLVNSGNATVDVSGIGTGAFTDSIVIVDTLTDISIFGVPAVLILDNTTGTGILLQTGSVFTTYDLRSSLGPLSGAGGVASGSHNTPIFPTTIGDLTWTVGQSLGTSTFTAVDTPEPGTLGFFGAGLVMVAWRRRFKQRP
jgi:hypothetical protein